MVSLFHSHARSDDANKVTTSAIFQAGSLLVLIAEVRTRAFLASLVPIIVNAVLNEHQLVLDIVAFVQLGDFPRSRLGEKQRGKILANWVSRKMRTIAQFSIRDPDAEGSVSTVGAPGGGEGRRESVQSGPAGVRRSGVGGGQQESSLRHATSISDIPLAEEPDAMELHEQQRQMESLALQTGEADPWNRDRDGGGMEMRNRSESRSDLTPTRETPRPLELNTTLDYSPVREKGGDDHWDDDGDSPQELPGHGQAPPPHPKNSYEHEMRASHADWGSWESYDPYANRGQGPPGPQAYQAPGQGQGYAEYEQHRREYGTPGARRGFDDEDDSPVDYQPGMGLGGGGAGGGGGLRVANANTGQADGDGAEHGRASSWEQDALRSMNLSR